MHKYRIEAHYLAFRREQGNAYRQRNLPVPATVQIQIYVRRKERYSKRTESAPLASFTHQMEEDRLTDVKKLLRDIRAELAEHAPPEDRALRMFITMKDNLKEANCQHIMSGGWF